MRGVSGAGFVDGALRQPLMVESKDSYRVEVSVIVPAFDAEDVIGACVEALAVQADGHPPFEVIIVDDGSSDQTADFAEKSCVAEVEAAWVSASVLTRPHRGAGAARNSGASAASGRLLVFTDADCRPLGDWLQCMVEPFQDPSVDAAMGRFLSDQEALVARIAQSEYAQKERGMLGRERIAFADTATAAVRSEVFHSVGGFRETLGAVEDTDLAFRLAGTGHRIVMAPRAFVFHRHPDTWLRYGIRKARFGRWGAWVYATHPSRVQDDTRTPGAMRIQMALVPALVALTILAAVGTIPSWAPASLAVVFLISAVPQSKKALRDDLGSVGVIAAPLAAAVRAFALDIGLAIGLTELVMRRKGRELLVRRIRLRKASDR